MTLLNDEKIKRLYSENTPSAPIVRGTLNRLNISRQLLYWYTKHGWLRKIAPGVFALPNAEVSWQGALSTLQNSSTNHIHLGGRTALEFYGLGHFLPLDVQKVFIFKSSQFRLPRWLSYLTWKDSEIIVVGTDFLGSEIGFETEKLDGFQLKLSSPERAAFEVIHLIGKYHSFNEAVLLSENFSNFRPKIMQSLLESCNSKKVKRLILMLGQYNKSPWIKHIDRNKIDLGKGIIQIEGGGKFIDEFKLSIPQRLEEYSNV